MLDLTVLVLRCLCTIMYQYNRTNKTTKSQTINAQSNCTLHQCQIRGIGPKQNLICLLDIDIQGAQNVKKSTLNAYYLFISPPSMEELEKRLRGRKTDSEEAMQRRLANAKGELEYGTQEGNFDAVLVNNDLDEALKEMVGKFEGWFPSLSTGGATAGNGEQAQALAQDPANLPPPIVDPLSFPKTEEGLTALLSAIDTKDCPLDSYVQTDLTYQASNVHIGAGKRLELPLPPVEQDGSKIDWNVTVDDPYDERLDIGEVYENLICF